MQLCKKGIREPIKVVKYNDLPNVFGGAKNKAEWEFRREEIKNIFNLPSACFNIFPVTVMISCA